MKSLRIVFFGTPEIAVPTLEGLLSGPHEVVGVVSQPDRPRGRGRKLSPSPVAAVALREDLPLWRPEKVGDSEIREALAELAPDLGVVVAFGQFLPKKIRELPSLGYLINAHASLLPKYRGAAPIARVILEGEAETGISVMRIEREMDAGPVALVVKTPIGATENTAELSERLALLANEAIGQAVDQIADDKIEWTEQDADQKSFAAKIEKSDSILDLRESARALAGRIHALSPKPGGTLTLKTAEDADPSDSASTSSGATESASEAGILLKVSRTEILDFEDHEGPKPGTLDQQHPEIPLRIATGAGWLVPRVMQKPGGKALPIADFLRGFTLPPSAFFEVISASPTNSDPTDPV